MSIVITRGGKGSALSATENDDNLKSLSGINEPQTGDYPIVAADQNRTIEVSKATAVAITLTEIQNGSTGILDLIDTDDFKVTILNIGAGAVTITPNAADSINTGDSTIVLATDEYVEIQTDSTELIWNIINNSNASKVDGLEASQFLRSDAADTATGSLTFSGNVGLDGGWDINGTAVTLTGTQINSAVQNTGDTMTGSLIVSVDGVVSPIYTNGQLEILTTDGNDASMSWRRVGHTATQLRHESDGLILSGVTRTTAANFFCYGQVKSDLAPVAINDLTRKDFVESGASTLTNKTLTSPKINENVALTATATELNIMDSGTVQATVTLVGTDGVVISDGTVMKQCLVSDFPVYARSVTETLTNKTLTSPAINTPTINSGVSLTVTSTELNIIDGSATVQATVTLLGTDGVVISDGDVMKQCLVSDFPVYARSVTETLTNKTLTSPVINTPTINGQAGYGVVILDEPEHLLTQTSTTADWTLVDMSSLYPQAATDGAVAAIIRCVASVTSSAAGISTCIGLVQKHGQGLAKTTTYASAYAYHTATASGEESLDTGSTTVSLDANSDFDYYVSRNNASSSFVTITLIGYYV